jgi:hypothetical protein
MAGARHAFSNDDAWTMALVPWVNLEVAERCCFEVRGSWGFGGSSSPSPELSFARINILPSDAVRPAYLLLRGFCFDSVSTARGQAFALIRFLQYEGKGLRAIGLCIAYAGVTRCYLLDFCSGSVYATYWRQAEPGLDRLS